MTASMFPRLHGRGLGLLVAVAACGSVACAASGGDGGRGRAAGSSGQGGGQSSGSGGSGGIGIDIINIPLPDGTDVVSLLPTGLRRLTTAEYGASVRALLDTEETPEADCAPDARQSGFTTNQAQRVDPVLARQISDAAKALAAEFKAKVETVAPCAAADEEACARTFIESFGPRAYRRPIDTAEIQSMLGLYRAGAEGASYADGIELVVRGMLQSASFLYLTELGGTPASGVVSLTRSELASSLSYLLTEAPPDNALLEAASAGSLDTPEGREAEVRRLLDGADARRRIVRLISEWLGIDRVDQIAKDTLVYPNFASVRDSMVAENAGFITEVVWSSQGTVSELLGADWTVADGELAGHYGVAGTGRVSLAETGRVGILNHAAFLSVYAHANESAPILRGVAVLSRVVCVPPPDPAVLQLAVPPVVPDETKTTRARFALHSDAPECANCHRTIDPFGFAFELYDGTGKYRTTEEVSGLPVDSSVTLDVGSPFDGSYADSNELAAALAASDEARECFARHLFRSVAARSVGVRESEDAFVEAWSELEAGDRDRVMETLVAYVKSPLFTHRRVP